MSEWVKGKLGDIAEIIMGQSPEGFNCSVEVIGIPLLNGPTEFTSKHPIPVQYTSNPKKLSSIGDILFCVRGSTTGKMNWSDQPYALGRGLAAIRHNAGRKLNRFVKAVIDYNLEDLLNGATGSTFPNVSRVDIASIPIKIPPISAQEAIAEVFNSIDDKIDILFQNSKTLEALAETLFRQWFIEDATGEGVETPLDAMAEFLNGLALQKFPCLPGESSLPVIKIREMNQE